MGVGMFGHDDHDDEQQDTTGAVDATPPMSDSTAPDPVPDQPADTSDTTVPDLTPTTADSAPAEDTQDKNDDSAPEADSDLLALKKQALEELSPLVEHLDQTAEEKFKTTMMLIQATDSSNLLSAAHEAAKQITDEKVRAQALLDIVNEINYFTQK